MKASLNQDFLQNMSQPEISWRWPIYQSWLTRNDFHVEKSSGEKVEQTPLWWNALPHQVLNRYQSATFIEWRYFSILSREFHGICGFSLFNPENHFPQLSEGGLIAIISGALQDGVATLSRARAANPAEAVERVQEFCFMHMFPMETVIFHGPNRQNVSASHNGVELKIDMLNSQTAEIQIEMEGGLSLRFHHQAVAGCPVLAPVTATDFRTLPGAHWTIFNPSPVASVNGSLVIRPGLLQLSERSPGVHNPNFISLPLAERLYNGYVKVQVESGAGYYEHSYGMNPMPLHGWDFLFVPSPESKSGLVLQTYKGSAAASYLEVLWAQPDSTWKTLHIPLSACQVEWSETSWHPVLRVHVPRKRIVRANYAGYKIEIVNCILGEIPFVRAHSPVVRHFFISEELSSTSWSVVDEQGRTCVQVKDALSGGETARGRWYYNLSGLFSLSAAKPF
ncbi:hypothetical protein EBU99_05280 [bacterium]|nr:hypothetical protein [bacterium]